MNTGELPTSWDLTVGHCVHLNLARILHGRRGSPSGGIPSEPSLSE
jgi:hypothetical protein